MIGKVDSDGTVRNQSNAQIGKIDNNYFVRNASNAQIGRATGNTTIKKEWIAAFYFFFFKDEVK